jgi:general secretion pathway protein D
VFSRRTIATKVTVKDGYTVVMGGLLREDLQTINDRVPFLGDLPMVGRLFQSKASKSTKKNLLIFTTCTIYLNNGERLNPTLK